MTPKDHCPSCGYTKEDAQLHGDHRLCKNDGKAPWQTKDREHRIDTGSPEERVTQVIYRRFGERYAYPEYRSDGWPLCPMCGEDELYSLEIPATAQTICGCYNCEFRPELETK